MGEDMHKLVAFKPHGITRASVHTRAAGMLRDWKQAYLYLGIVQYNEEQCQKAMHLRNT